MAYEPYFAVGAVAMGLGTAGFVALRARESETERYHTIVVAIAGIATVAYAAMAAGIGTVAIDGSPLFVPRYVDWLFTTPLIVLYLGLLADAGRQRLAVLLVLDAVMVLSGPVAAVLAPPATWAVYAVGVACQVGLLYGLLVSLQRAATDRAWNVQALFQKLRNLTVATWAFYPVVWLLGPHGLGTLAPVSDVLLVVYFDVVAKVGFGFIAFDSTLVLDRLAEDPETAATGS